MQKVTKKSEQTYDENYELIHGKDIYIEDSIEDIEEFVNAEVDAKVKALRELGVSVTYVPTESDRQAEWLENVKRLADGLGAKYFAKGGQNA